MKNLLLLLALLVCSPAVAQWQVPANTIPIGRGPGVTGFATMPNTGTGTLCLLNTVPPAFGSCGATTNFTVTPQGRLTLTSATPVMATSVTAATAILYTPYAGNIVPIFDSVATFTATPFAEVSQATIDTTKSPGAVANNSVYDIFCWVDSGTNRCTRGPAWSNSTTRGYSLTIQNGILLNTASITNGPAALRGTYVGTIASNGTATLDYIFGAPGTGGVAAVFNVWNAYNRVPVMTTVQDSTASWLYNPVIPNVWRAADASTTIYIQTVRGFDEDGIWINYNAVGAGAGSSSAIASGVGLDTNADFNGSTGYDLSNTSFHSIPAFYSGLPGRGVHKFWAVEFNSVSNNSSWLGYTADLRGSGLHGQLRQ